MSNANKHHHSLRLFVTALFLGSTLAPWLLPLRHAKALTAPGVEIRNRATGSFEDPDDLGTVIDVTSNEVVVTVSEVAGITLTSGNLPTEAPNSVNSGNPTQGDGAITSDDVVYFTYTLTNVGNDPTQFSIPDSPSSITNGTLFGPIEIIGYDPDGTGTTPVDLTSNTITVPLGGGSLATGTLLNGISGTNDGSVPANGTITIRVPVQANNGLIDGSQVTVVMGDASGAQNVAASGGTDDVATVDNSGTANGDEAGAPSNNEREASLSQSVSVGADSDFDGIPDFLEGNGDRDGDGIPDSQDFDPQGYFYDSETGQILNGGSIIVTPPPGGTVDLISDGSNGAFQWIASGAAGIYTMTVTPPPGYTTNLACPASTPAYDPTGNPSPDSLGSSENGTTGVLISSACADNPYYLEFDLAPGDPLIIDNNLAFVPSSGRDYGDAPNTYGTTAASNGASHVIVTGLQLGTAPDFEADAVTPLDGSGDGAEDDGITLATLTEGDTTYTIPAADITATNTTGTAATLHAWVDFDGSGTFEADEYASQTVQSGNSNPDGDLTWSGISGLIGGTTTYARFRLTTYAGLSDDAGTPGLDERAVGPATSGEVEDYGVAIATATNTANLILVKRVTAIAGTSLTSIVDDPGSIEDNDGLWPAGYLQGSINTGTVEPGEDIEYTIYFLSNGSADLADVNICDHIPANTTYVPGSGELAFGTNAATTWDDTRNADEGEYFAPNTTITNTDVPEVGLCRADHDTTLDFPDTENTNGAIWVEIDKVTTPIPAGQAGYIRFRVTVNETQIP